MPYSFGKTSFKNSVWLNNGQNFTDVGLVEIEMINSGAFRLEVVNAQGAVISSGKRPNPNGGWHTFSFSGGIIPPVLSGTYRLRLVNEAPGTREALQGQVTP